MKRVPVRRNRADSSPDMDKSPSPAPRKVAPAARPARKETTQRGGRAAKDSSPDSVKSASPVAARRKRRSPSPKKVTKLHIGGLTRNINKDHLLEIFSVYGRVRTIDLPLDKLNFLPRGLAYIEFENADDADQARRHMNGGWIDGQEVTTKAVLQPDPKPMMPQRDNRPNNNWRGGPRRSPMGRRSPPMRRSPIRRSPIRRRGPPPRRSRSRSGPRGGNARGGPPRRRSPSPRRPPPRRRGSVSSGRSSSSRSKSPPPQRRGRAGSPPAAANRRRRYSKSSSSD